jgi:hypothetical protein
MRPAFAAFVLFVTTSAFAQTTHDGYEALFESAISAIAWDFQEEWAFTETASGSDGDFVGRFDPRVPEGQRWTLLSIDGREPTDKESARYAEDKEDEDFGDEDGDEDSGEDNDVDAMVKPGTLQLVEETDDYWLLSFVPTDDDEEDEIGRKVLQHMNGTVKILKDGEYLEFIDIHNDKPIKPKIGVKMNKFLMRMTFGPAIDDGPVVMKSMDVAIKLRAFLVVSVNEAESIRFSDFEYAGEAH